jgi:hypothetical protein
MHSFIYIIQDIDLCWGNMPYHKGEALQSSLQHCDYSPALSKFYSTILPFLKCVFICTARETGLKDDLKSLGINAQSIVNARGHRVEEARQHLVETLQGAKEKVKVSTVYDDPELPVGNAMDCFFKAEASSTSFPKSQIKHKDKVSQYQMIFREILEDLRDTNDPDACAEVVMFDDTEHNHEAFKQAIQSLSSADQAKITARSVRYEFISPREPDTFIPRHNYDLSGDFLTLAEDLKQKAASASTVVLASAAPESTVVLASAVPVSAVLASTAADPKETNVQTPWTIFKHKMQVLVLASSTVSVLGICAALAAVQRGFTTMNIIALGICNVSIGVLNFGIGVLNAAGISISTLGTVSTVSTALPFGIAAAVLIIGFPLIFATLATAFNASSKPSREVRPVDDQTSRRKQAAQLEGAAAVPADGSGHIRPSEQRENVAAHTP